MSDYIYPMTCVCVGVFKILISGFIAKKMLTYLDNIIEKSRKLTILVLDTF